MSFFLVNKEKQNMDGDIIQPELPELLINQNIKKDDTANYSQPTSSSFNPTTTTLLFPNFDQKLPDHVFSSSSSSDMHMIDWVGLLSDSLYLETRKQKPHHDQQPPSEETDDDVLLPVLVTGSTTNGGCKSKSSSNKGKMMCNNKSGITKKTVNLPSPRVAFHTRSAEDVLDDGFRWRKYGQKAVKHCTHPRSYYRCTHHTCNVKKQIQRHWKDPSIVVTTYEGIHNHPSDKLMETLTPLLNQLQFLSSI